MKKRTFHFDIYRAKPHLKHGTFWNLRTHASSTWCTAYLIEKSLNFCKMSKNLTFQNHSATVSKTYTTKSFIQAMISLLLKSFWEQKYLLGDKKLHRLRIHGPEQGQIAKRPLRLAVSIQFNFFNLKSHVFNIRNKTVSDFNIFGWFKRME